MSVLKFFSITFIASWTCFFVATRVSGAAATILLLLGTFAPSFVALALSERRDALLERVFEYRVGVRWYIFAVSYLAAIKLVVALLHRAITGAWPRFGGEPWYILVAAIIISTPVQAGEEIG